MELPLEPSRLVPNSLKCRFCASQDLKYSKKQRTILFDNEKFLFVKCNNCKSYFLFPELSDRQIKNLYSIDYVQDNPHFSIQDGPSENTWQYLDAINRLKSHNFPKGSKILDYGCGANSNILNAACSMGLLPYGVEFDAKVRLLASKNSGATILSPEELVKRSEKFEVIFLGDVLEHLNNPAELLNLLSNKLTKNGFILVQNPLQGAGTLLNFSLDLLAVLTPFKFSKFPPYHVNLFTLKGMISLGFRCNLSAVKVRVFEVDWPAPTWTALLHNSNLRSALLFALKSIDKAFSNLWRTYGTRVILEYQTYDSLQDLHVN